jgi:hypothetical protein
MLNFTPQQNKTKQQQNKKVDNEVLKVAVRMPVL